jgi:eukaryotic-like serine/threonine-protein kinase
MGGGVPTEETGFGDRQLLAGVLAVQLGLATPAQVLVAASAWAAERGLGLVERLLAQGVLQARQAELLEGLLRETLAQHGGEAAAAVRTLGGDHLLRQTFQGSIVLEPGGHLELSAQAPVTAADAGEVTAESAGRYEPRGEQGRGGQARVLRVFDRHLGREVACKEMLGATAPAGGAAEAPRTAGPSTARFLREARITGGLEHPNIVPVYELGRRADGQLYYTMRLVRGRSLAATLAAAGDLDARLRLLGAFWDVCNAVAFAHAQGVIHRDLKPDNVMVGEFGETVVLDWGLAKPRGEAEDVRREDLSRQVRHWQKGSQASTLAGSALGTPAYMSPEQAEGHLDAIDERSDVWGLGAMLYELLTGRPPFAGESPYEIIGKVMREPIPPVRSVCPAAPAELAAIAERALRRPQAERYQNARELAEDVSAYMTGGRVRAHAYRLGDLVRRFARRHRVALVTAGIGLCLLLGLAGYSYSRVVAERDQARTQRAAAMRFANLLVHDLFDKIEPLAGSTPALQALLEPTARYLTEQVEGQGGDPRERLDLAIARRKLGDVARAFGKRDEARRVFGGLATALEGLGELGPLELERRLELERNLLRLGELAEEGGDLVAARRLYTQAEAVVRDTPEPGPGTPGSRDLFRARFSIAERLGDLDSQDGHLADARGRFEANLAMTDRELLAAPQDEELLGYRAAALDRLARQAKGEGRSADARRLFEENRAIYERLAAAAPSDAEKQHSVLIALFELGRLALADGDLPRVRELLQRSIDMSRRLLAADPANLTWQHVLVANLDLLGQGELAAGELDRARLLADQGRELLEALVAADPGDDGLQSDLSLMYQRLYTLELAMGREESARAFLVRQVDIKRRVATADPTSLLKGLVLAEALFGRADQAWLDGAAESSRADVREGCLLAERAAAAEPDAAPGLGVLALCRMRSGRASEAADLRRQLLERDPGSAAAAAELAETCLAAGRYPEAAEAARRALEVAGDPPRRVIMLAFQALAEEGRGDRQTARERALEAARLARTLGPLTLSTWSFVALRANLERLPVAARKRQAPLVEALDRWTRGERGADVARALERWAAGR